MTYVYTFVSQIKSGKAVKVYIWFLRNTYNLAGWIWEDFCSHFWNLFFLYCLKRADVEYQLRLVNIFYVELSVYLENPVSLVNFSGDVR